MEGNAKILIRDVDGRLVSYTEGLKIRALNNTLTDLLLSEKFEVKDVITRNGQDYEVLVYPKDAVERRTGSAWFMVGATGIKVHQNGTFVFAMSTSSHHGYLTQTGEILSITLPCSRVLLISRGGFFEKKSWKIFAFTQNIVPPT